MSLKAYQKTQRTFANPRDTEYRLFAQITSALIDAKDLPRTDQRLIQAIARNRELWTVLAADCGAEGNKLDDKLRAQIISLSLWVGRYSSTVMRERADVAPLIDINRTIMEGLAPRNVAPQAEPKGPAQKAFV
jgi:flagellar biosynthesis activator protein FlaF